MVVEAGCVLEVAKQAADAEECLLPITFGSQGPSRIGGNVSTNAGGQPSSPRERPVIKPGERTHISIRCATIAKGPSSEENNTSGIGADDEQYWPLTDGP